MKQGNLFEKAFKGENEGVVYQTRNYSMFKYVDGNRNIDERNVIKLASDIRRRGQIQPVLVDSEYYVIDGQNRIAACEKLRVPVKWEITSLNGLPRLEYIQAVNTQRKNWGWKNYLKMYCQMEKPAYLNYKKLMGRFMFDHTAMLAVILSRRWDGGSSGTNDFNKGDLKIRYLEDVINRLENIEEYWRLISRAYSNMPGKTKSKPPAKLVKAFVVITKHENFDHKIMIMKLKNDVSGFVGINTRDSFVAELTKIYNLRNRGGIIKFN